MSYLDKTLIFEEDKIYYEDSGMILEIMMDWEDSIMKASADYVCENGGDILEFGFGMGISAGYIQANNINSHTIIENHPQIIERLRLWATDKPNVKIIIRPIVERKPANNAMSESRNGPNLVNGPIKK